MAVFFIPARPTAKLMSASERINPTIGLMDFSFLLLSSP